MIAYVDESMRQNPEGLYLLAAVFIARDEYGLDLLRREMQDLKLRQEPRFHWRNEGERQRMRMMSWVAGTALPTRVYIRRPTLRRQQHRARSQCLKALLWDLEQLGFNQLVLESRQEHNDQKDRQTIVWAQKAGWASADLHYRFARPKDEPLLWMADAVAGAASADLAKETGTYLKALQPGQIVITEVRL